MKIRVAEKEDLEILRQYDTHISSEELAYALARCRVYIVEVRGQFAGWLRYNLFWDNTPFLNMLYLLEEFRGKGYGKEVVRYWESRMAEKKYDCVMTSTASDEYAQHFYMRLGYCAIGGFTYREDPFELILMKEI